MTEYDEQKLFLKNLPKRIQRKQIQQIFEMYKFPEPKKIIRHFKQDNAVIQFNTIEEAKRAFEELNDKKFKDYTISLQKVPKRKFQDLKDKKNENEELFKQWATQTTAEILNDKVTPLWKTIYDQQLVIKQRAMKKVLKLTEKGINGIELEELLPIVPSPIQTGYRNKCEFSIGPNFDYFLQEIKKEQLAKPKEEGEGEGEENEETEYSEESKEMEVEKSTLNDKEKLTVGFMVGSFTDGNLYVAPVDECVHISQESKHFAKWFEEFLKHKTELSFYDRQTKAGHYRLLLTRTQYRTKQNMVLIQMHPQDLTGDDLQAEKDLLRNFFLEKSRENELFIDSLLFQVHTGVHNGFEADLPVECLYGVPYIKENLVCLNLEEKPEFEFRLSAPSFFQTSTLSCEVLYQQIGNWLMETEKKIILLDLCCGAGTIGITLSKLPQIHEIIGIEVCKEAIEDALLNKEVNQIENARYICAKVEDCLPSLLKEFSCSEYELIVLLDPPRAGVHKTVLNAIRTCSLIQKVIFVSCHPEQAYTNFVHLCRNKSSQYSGTPFKLTRMLPVDMFPQTKLCELLVEFKRESEKVEDKKAE